MFEQRDLQYLLELSRLTVPKEEEEELTRQINDILNYFEVLSGYDTSSVDVDLGESVPVDSRRTDGSRPGLERDSVEKFAPSFNDGFFVVPRILGDGDA